jgi:hypothetical protein
MDPQSQLRYAELLAQNSEYISAANILDGLQKNGSATTNYYRQEKKDLCILKIYKRFTSIPCSIS